MVRGVCLFASDDFPPRFPPLYCIYGPIDIEFPDNLGPLITDFMGGFGFFP